MRYSIRADRNGISQFNALLVRVIQVWIRKRSLIREGKARKNERK